MAAEPPGEREALIASALGREWYHTIEIAPGVRTPGLVDLRSIAPRVLPDDLSGVRALDVGTFDGFWAFELERRRAAEVVAADLDSYLDTEWPPPTFARLADELRGHHPGERFKLAHELLGSRVRRVGSAIYDLDVERLGGPVGYAVVGALLLHLRDPVRGLERVREVLEPGGRLLVVEPFDLWLTALRPRRPAAVLRARHTDFDWWVGNFACLNAWLHLAGFVEPRRRAIFRLPAGRPIRQWFVAYEARAPAARPST
ncbi:MAG: hypothetical protein E6G30_02725 [Actinobacteria bacterium]|nr:MAG: hypothetical protein E6G30_02725 [Actinomycetota bacterium]